MYYRTKIFSYLVFLVLYLVNGKECSAQLKKSDIDNAIEISKLEHPYLYFNNTEKKELLDRINTDQESNDVFRKLKARAKVWMAMPVDKNIPIQGKNTRADWSEEDRSSKYSDYYKNNRNNAFYLAFLYQMTGDVNYAQKAFEFADAFCDLTTWTQRAHEFPIIYSRIMPWNVPDDQVNFNFDHFNGDSGRMMAAVYDWLYPALTKPQRDRIRGALLEKVITRVRGDYEFHWWATAYRCNWCGVCNSGVGLAGLTLLKEHPQLTDVVAESYNRINSMFNELGHNGGWQEGGSYWNYGVHTSSFFADALKRLTNNKFNLFNNKRLADNPVTFPLYISLPGDKSLNFEDSGGNGWVGSTHLINKLATETQNPNAVWYRNFINKEANDIFDIIWPRPKFNALPPRQSSIHFKTIDWWVMRSDFSSTDKVVVAGKAGKNDDPHHGHLDIGHFVVYWNKEYYIRDLGKSGYDEKYFDQARFDYPEANSEGHNTILVNGESQISGKYYKKPYDYSVGGAVLDFRTTAQRDYVLMDATNAYPKKELKKWRRNVVLEKPQITLVLDEIHSNKNAAIQVRFHPGVNLKILQDYVLLKGKEGTMALIPFTEKDFTINQGRHPSQMVNATQSFSWIPYFDLTLKATGYKTIIGNLILPVDNENQVEDIMASKKIELNKDGNLSIIFSYKNKIFKYYFKNNKSGLELD
ncbi:MAG: heparinase II/III family protein [Bacteroidota bacterium]|nr:heparinase II/III family protein [Bacteroidota bacterium]